MTISLMARGFCHSKLPMTLETLVEAPGRHSSVMFRHMAAAASGGSDKYPQ